MQALQKMFYKSCEMRDTIQYSLTVSILRFAQLNTPQDEVCPHHFVCG